MDETSSPLEGLEALGKSVPMAWSSASGSTSPSNSSYLDFPTDPGDPVSPNNSSDTEVEKVDRDADYYMESTFVVFEVDNQLFRVPSYMFFEESPTFVEIFDLDTPGPSNVDDLSTSQKSPIVITDVPREDFRNLLKTLYPRFVSLTLSLSKLEWISVLKLSTVWRFLNLRKLSREKLETTAELRLTSTEKIILGRKVHISSWVIEGYEELVLGDETIEDEDAVEIGLLDTLWLFRIRERLLRGRVPPPWPVAMTLEETFQGELNDIRALERTLDQADLQVVPEKEGSENGLDWI